jgi:hypothetical protein
VGLVRYPAVDAKSGFSEDMGSTERKERMRYSQRKKAR